MAPIFGRRGGRPDRTIRYGEHRDQVIDVRGAGPAVMFIHGGYWRPSIDRAHAAPLSGALAALGYSVATIEYRRVPGRADDLVADVESALASVTAELGHPLVVGHSAGGHLALLLAARSPVRGALALAPVASLALADELDLGGGAVRAFLGTAGADRTDLDPTELPDAPMPVTIVHGDRDDVVPLSVGERYTLRHPTARLVVVPNASHMAVIEPRSAAWPMVLAELAALATRAT